MADEPVNIEAVVGYRPDKSKIVMLHGDRVFWRIDGLWYDLSGTPDGNS